MYLAASHNLHPNPAPWTEPIWLIWLPIQGALEPSMGVSPTLFASGLLAQ